MGERESTLWVLGEVTWVVKITGRWGLSVRKGRHKKIFFFLGSPNEREPPPLAIWMPKFFLLRKFWIRRDPPPPSLPSRPPFGLCPPTGKFRAAHPLPIPNPEQWKAKAGSTPGRPQAVPHPSTNRALCRLTSEVRRDPVHSTRYGRQRIYS